MKSSQEHQNIFKLTGEECLLEKKWRRLEKEKKRKRKKSDQINLFQLEFKFFINQYL
jgi:hypothetical protein